MRHYRTKQDSIFLYLSRLVVLVVSSLFLAFFSPSNCEFSLCLHLFSVKV